MRKRMHFHTSRCYTLYLLLSIAAILLGSLSAKGADEIFNSRESGSRIKNGLVLYVADDKYDYMRTHPSWATVFNNHKVTNKLILSIDPYGKNFMNQSFTARVQLQVVYDVWDQASNGFVQQSKYQELEVQYSTSGPYKDKNTVLIENGGQRMQVSVTGVIFTNGSSAITLNFTPNLSLEAEIEVERFYAFDPSFVMPSSSVRHSTNLQIVNGRNELMVNWDQVAGAEEYDLEWAHVNNFDQDGKPLSINEVQVDPNIFRLNSTRITTPNLSYNIPLTLEPGFILYRVRPVGRDPQSDYTQILQGSWSDDPAKCKDLNLSTCMGAQVYQYSGLSTSLNWQSTVDYIEGGKNKVNIQYFDATLRNRQEQTRLNTQDQVLIGETIYDRDGRAAIKVLPVPENKTNIIFSDSLSRNAQGAPYSKNDFDQNCNPAGPMESAIRAGHAGASNYYSPDNPNKSNQQAYLPDAQKYPFIQAQFTPDHTGRVRAQSGVGADHRIGNGHDTKFYYGQPFQEELDRLFGLDVGLEKNYRKNVTVDPNRQVTVTYLDEDGKTIATALAGVSPQSLDALPGTADRTINIDLLSKNNPSDPVGSLEMLSPDSRTRTLNRNYIATSTGPRSFHYDIQAGTFQAQCETPGSSPRCYNCVVDLRLSIKDECGTEVYPAFNHGTNDTTVGTISPGCTTSPGSFSPADQSINMNVGSYQISKVVSINQPALDVYTADFLDSAKNTCLLTFQDFYAEELTNVDVSGCNVTCDMCRDKIGVFDSWDLNDYNKSHNPNCDPCLTQSQYDKLLSSCDRLCENQSPTCDAGLLGMISDVSPYGQYGEVLASQTPLISKDGVLDPTAAQVTSSDIDPTKHDLSVFNVNNKLQHHKGTPDWKHPKLYTDPTQLHYYDDKGNVDSVNVLVLSPDPATSKARFLPDLDDAAKASNSGAQPGTYISVAPQSLNDVKDFLALWKPSWAQSLVIYHPEYCYYEICLKTQPSNDFDADWLSVNKVADAQAKFGFGSDLTNLPQPLKDTALNAIDPYFNLDPSINPRYKFWEYYLMKYRMNHYKLDPNTGKYITIWQAAFITATCPNYSRAATSCPNCLTEFKGINTDSEWVVFRSLYISLKQTFQDYKTRLETIGMGCYNGCIGVENFDPSVFQIYDPTINTFNYFRYSLSPYYSSSQTCNSGSRDLYKNKAKRFPAANDMMDIKTKSGTCPEDVVPVPSDGNLSALSFPSIDELANCPNHDNQEIQDLQIRVNQIIFETCGQCPLARDLQLLLDALAREDKDSSGNVIKPSQLTATQPVRLSCYPFASQYKEFTAALETALNLPGNTEVVWDHVTVNGKRLDASIHREGRTESCAVSLVIPASSPYNFSDIKGMCCLTYTGSPKLLPLQAGKNFTLEGIVGTTMTSGTTQYVTVGMEGVSCVNISTCPMPPVCDVSDQGTALQNLFNALISESTSGSPKFVTNGAEIDIYSPTPGQFNPYDALIRGVLDDPATGALNAPNWVWKSSLSGSQLNAFIKDKASAATVLFEFFLPPGATFSFSDILFLENITPDISNTDPEHNFKISAVIKNADGTKSNAILTGFSGSYKISSCRQVVAPK